MENQEAALQAEISLLKQSVKILEDNLWEAEQDADAMRSLAMHQTDLLLKFGVTHVQGHKIG